MMENDVKKFLSEQDEKFNKTMECLRALKTINDYFDDEETVCNPTYWGDKDGYSFDTDAGYFFSGLTNFEKYLRKRIERIEKDLNGEKSEKLAEITFLPVCSRCRKIINKEIKYEEHYAGSSFYKVHEISPFTCPTCNAFFTSISMPQRLPFKEQGD